MHDTNRDDTFFDGEGQSNRQAFAAGGRRTISIYSYRDFSGTAMTKPRVTSMQDLDEQSRTIEEKT